MNSDGAVGALLLWDVNVTNEFIECQVILSATRAYHPTAEIKASTCHPDTLGTESH